MKKTKAGERDVETFTSEERRRVENAMNFRFNAYQKPGETISVDAEKGDEYVYTELSLEAPDDSFRLDLEAAVLAADQSQSRFPDPDAILDVAFEFLKLRLYEFFQSERTERFHIDWRHYTVEGTALRFRGRIRKPQLEEKADEWLDEHGDEAEVDALEELEELDQMDALGSLEDLGGGGGEGT